LAKQISEQQGNQFSTNTQPNPKEHCKAISTRSGKVVGAGIGDNLRPAVEERIDEGEESELQPEKSESRKQNSNLEEGAAQPVVKEKEQKLPMQNIPYPHTPSRKDAERQFRRFVEVVKKLQINIPFTEALEQMPIYTKFMKDLLTKKRKFLEQETIELEAGCSAIIQKALPQKYSDPGSFTLPVTIGNLTVGKALLDLGASINLIPLSMLKKIGDVEVRPTRMTLQLADRSIKHPYGIVEDLLFKVDKFMFLVDFVIMEMEEDLEVPLILGRPFMKTARVMIDVDKGKLKVCVQDEEVRFNVFDAMKHPSDSKGCFWMDVLDRICEEQRQSLLITEPLMRILVGCKDQPKDLDEEEVSQLKKDLDRGKVAENTVAHEAEDVGSKSHKQTLELKQLPAHLKYVFLAENGKKPVIISNALTREEEKSADKGLQENQEEIGWTLVDLKGISPSYCMHHIYMEKDYQPVV